MHGHSREQLWLRLLTPYLGTGFTLEVSNTGPNMTGLKISEVAERGGVNLETIRYYEREGL